MKTRGWFWSAALAASLLLAAPTYKVVREIPIGGEGGWDYVTLDSAAHRLFVSHATKVAVVDTESGKVIGEIPDTPGVHGVALAQPLGKGFVSNGRSNNVTVFDLTTLAATGKVQTGQNPDAIIYEPVSGRIFTFNGRSKDSTVFDAKTGTVAATIPLGGKPEFSVIDGQGRLYVNIEDTGEIVQLDGRKASVVKRYSIKPCEDPSGLAIDVAQGLLFSVCGNKLMAISQPETGKIIATVRIGEGSDGVAYDPERHLAFSSNGEGSVTVVGQQGGKWQMVSTVPTRRGARTVTIDPRTHQLYLPTADFGPESRPRPAVLPGTFRVLVLGS